MRIENTGDVLNTVNGAIAGPIQSTFGKVFIGIPTHDGRIDAGTQEALARASKTSGYAYAIQVGSLLNFNCNMLWSYGLNGGYDWFAMLHSDIEAPDWWLDSLIALAMENNADIMSAVIPIKDDRGLTSTAIFNPKDPWNPYVRLTMHQITSPGFPKTFDIDVLADALELLPEPYGVRDVPRECLMVNTGCMVCRLKKDWNTHVQFETRDRIVMNEKMKIGPQVQPEDWIFSRHAQKAGAKVMATSVLKLNHRGLSGFPSDQAWGMHRDPLYKAQPSPVPVEAA